MNLRSAVIALLLPLLAGCGFHWRGSQPLPEEHAVVAVRDAGRAAAGTWYGGGRDELRRVVARAFDQAGVLVVDEAPLVVELLGEDVRRRTAAIGATATAAEYQLEYELRYRVVAADGREVMAPRRIPNDASYRYNESAVMGSADEEALLRREMRAEAALQLVRQYRRLALRLGAPEAGHEPAAP